jgi:tetratricopeptide (TPR) repeat protein
MTGIEFEGFLCQLFAKLGYSVRTTPATGDQGGDLILTGPADIRQVVVQAKRSARPVGNRAVQEILGAIAYYGCSAGIVVTNAEFTASALSLAAKEKRVEMWNGSKLASVYAEHFPTTAEPFDRAGYERLIERMRRNPGRATAKSLNGRWQDQAPTEAQVALLWKKDSGSRCQFKNWQALFAFAIEQHRKGDQAWSRGGVSLRLERCVRSNAVVTRSSTTDDDANKVVALDGPDRGNKIMENAVLDAALTGVYTEASLAAAIAENAATVARLTATFPEGATPQDKLILKFIHANKSIPKVGDKDYGTFACFGGALFHYFHCAMVPGFTTLTADQAKTAGTAVDAKIEPFIKSAVDRGVVDRFAVNGEMLYFDSREKARRDGWSATTDLVDARAWGAKGFTLRRSGCYEEAVAAYDQALALNPNESEYWREKGILLAILKRSEEAVSTLNHALATTPTDKETWWWKGMALASTNPEEAFDAFQRAAEIGGKEWETWLSLPWLLGADHPMLVFAAYQRGLAACERQIAMNPNDSEVWRQKGTALSEMNRYTDALEAFDRALTIDPGDSDAWLHKGMALAAMDRTYEALAAYEHVAPVYPDTGHASLEFARAKLYQGTLLQSLGHNQEALKAYDVSLGIAPDYAITWFNKAILLEEAERFQEALQAYEHVLVLDPDHAEALRKKAALLQRTI